MLLSIAAGGLLARGVLASTRPLWHDEVFTVWAARMSPRALSEALRHDSGPPLFYLLEKPLVWLGEKAGRDVVIRVLPYLAAATIFMGAWALANKSRLWFALLAAVSPLLLLYAAEGRAYALLATLDFAAFLLLFRGPPRPRRLVLGALAAAAALWTHYLALFFVTVAGALLLATRRWRQAGALLAALATFLPWLPVLLSQPSDATAWMHESAGRSAVLFLAASGGSGRVPLPVGALLPEELLVVAAVIGGTLLASIVVAGRRDRMIADALLLTTGTLALLIAVSFARPVALGGRSEMAVLPIWLWAVARASGEKRWIRLPATAALIFGVVTSVLSLTFPRLEAAPNPVARLLSREARSSDRVIASTAYYLPLRLASDRGELRARLLAFPPDLASHPGWFAPQPPPPPAYEALMREIRQVPRGGRAFFVAHPLWAGPELRYALERAGTARQLIQRPDVVVLVWSTGSESP